MEEEKAAAYYNELLGKGRNAALFKQGLGFGSNATNAAPAKHGMINFVGAGKSTEAGKESDQPRPTSEPADTPVAPAAKYGMINFVGAGKAVEAAEARKELEEPRPFSKPADRQVLESFDTCCSVPFSLCDVIAFILNWFRMHMHEFSVTTESKSVHYAVAV